MNLGTALDTINIAHDTFGDASFTVDELVAEQAAYLPGAPTIRGHLSKGRRAGVVEMAGYRYTGTRGRPSREYRINLSGTPDVVELEGQEEFADAA